MPRWPADFRSNGSSLELLDATVDVMTKPRCRRNHKVPTDPGRMRWSNWITTITDEVQTLKPRQTRRTNGALQTDFRQTIQPDLTYCWTPFRLRRRWAYGASLSHHFTHQVPLCKRLANRPGAAPVHLKLRCWVGRRLADRQPTPL